MLFKRKPDAIAKGSCSMFRPPFFFFLFLPCVQHVEHIPVCYRVRSSIQFLLPVSFLYEVMKILASPISIGYRCEDRKKVES